MRRIDDILNSLHPGLTVLAIVPEALATRDGLEGLLDDPVEIDIPRVQLCVQTGCPRFLDVSRSQQVWST